MSADTYISQISELRSVTVEPAEYKLLEKAFTLGEKAHAGQLRANGKNYFTEHCVPVSLKLASLGFEDDVLAAGLLHDTIEDTNITYDQLVEEFSEDLAFLVDGVTKLGQLKYKGNERHIESLRKFFVAVAKDPRVIVIKLCDRWHNLSTLEYLPEEKRKRIALESIEIHAQLASRLNMGQLVAEINDLAFPYAFPDEYKKTKDLRDAQIGRESELVTKMYRDILQDTTEALGYQPHVDKRTKSLFSLFRKLEKKEWAIDEIYDLIALRVIVRDTADCYRALGVIHSHWRPVPGRVKDYIAMPKPNGYQSLHTSVFSGSGPIIEIQIRTEEMHRHNEYGIASHHMYKERQHNPLSTQTFHWLEQLSSFQQESTSEAEYISRLRTDFFQDRIFCMTPKGDVIDLPLNATVLDFAFAVHSEIGATAVGAKVDGKYVALKTVLENEQRVEIVVDKKAAPSEKWLDWVITNHAKEKIKRYLTKKHRAELNALHR